MASVTSNNDDAREENRCTWPTAVARKVSAPRCCAIMVNGGGVTTEDFTQRRCATLASDGGVTRAERAKLLRHSGQWRRRHGKEHFATLLRHPGQQRGGNNAPRR